MVSAKSGFNLQVHKAWESIAVTITEVGIEFWCGVEAVIVMPPKYPRSILGGNWGKVLYLWRISWRVLGETAIWKSTSTQATSSNETVFVDGLIIWMWSLFVVVVSVIRMSWYGFSDCLERVRLTVQVEGLSIWKWRDTFWCACERQRKFWPPTSTNPSGCFLVFGSRPVTCSWTIVHDSGIIW